MVEEERSLQARNKVLMATVEAVNEQAYECATLADLAQRAGVTTEAVHVLFPSKDAVAHALIEMQHARTQARAQAIRDRGYPALEVMLRVSADLMREVASDPLVRAGIRLATEIHLLESPPTRSWGEWIAFNDALMTIARDEGDLTRDFDLHDIAEILTGSLAGLIVVSNLLEDLPRLILRARGLWRQFVRSYAPIEKVPYWVGRVEKVFTPA